MFDNRFEDKRGFYVLATKRIEPGALIMEEEPVAAVLDEIYKHTHCSTCFQAHASLQCTACHQNRYCNRECQRKDWKIHKIECNALNKADRNLNMTIRFLIRLLVTTKVYPEKGKGLRDPNPSNRPKYQSIGSLISHYQDFSHQKLSEYELIANGIELILDSEYSGSIMDRILLLCLSSCNSMTISDQEGVLGGGLYPNLCKINHACKPNTVIIFEGTKARLRALSPIEPGQELVFSYIDFLPKLERRQQIRETYFFECQCEWCCSLDEPLDLLKCPECKGKLSCNRWLCFDCGYRLEHSKRVLVSEFLESIDLVQSHSLDTLLDTLEQAKELLWPSHVMMFTLLNQIFSLASRLQKWETAFQVSVMLQETHKEIYGSMSPKLAIQCYISANLAQKLELKDMPWIYDAAKMLKMFYPNSPITNETIIKCSVPDWVWTGKR